MFLHCLSLIKFLLSLFLLQAASAASNVLLIIADDFGTDSHSLYNPTSTTAAPTPNINGLASSGVRFTQAYACPVCSPTRACILTGRYGFRTGVGDVAAGTSVLTATETTLPEVVALQSSLGIQCASFGKWHLSNGTPAAVRNDPNTIGGWPHYAGATSGALSSYTNWTKTTNGVNTTVSTYATTDVVNDATSWINARTSSNQPWIAWVAFNAPHTPFHIPPTQLHSYGANPASNFLKYCAAVEAMDTEIGRLLQSVNFSTTHVIFIGDNGTPGQVIQLPYNNTHAKDTLYEGGTRVPFIIKGPSVVAGGRTDASLVHVVDLFSTILDLAGVPIPEQSPLDSRSLLPILAGQVDATRKLTYVEKFNVTIPTDGGRALRDSRYKMIRLNSGVDEFYDLQTDPTEATNLMSGGTASLSEIQLNAFQQLRFQLAAYTTATSVAPISYAKSAQGFSLTVPLVNNTNQTLWMSADLQTWSPVTLATEQNNAAQLTLTAPEPLPNKAFFSVLTEPQLPPP